VLLIVNAHHDVVPFKLPAVPEGEYWSCLVDTDRPELRKGSICSSTGVRGAGAVDAADGVAARRGVNLSNWRMSLSCRSGLVPPIGSRSGRVNPEAGSEGFASVNQAPP
jgi:hypothetical protein